MQHYAEACLQTNNTPRVLIVDDDHDLLNALHYVFEKKGCLVTMAGNATEALDLVKMNKFDIVISDVVMPKMTGRDLLIEIEKIQGNKPYVLMMSSQNPYTPLELATVGSYGYLQKPFTPEQLTEVIESYISLICDHSDA
jgi:two-component system, response regulator FlrC